MTDILYHLYAEDTQMYLSFKPDDVYSESDAISKMSLCISKVSNWMYENKLKLNQDKTEFMLIGRTHELNKITVESVNVGNISVPVKSSVRNLGAVFDCNLSMEAHVNNICKTSMYHLKSISHIRKYLSREATEKLIHALVTSRIDYCNSLLSGVTSKLLSKMQRVQNTAARLIYRRRVREHISPVLHQLHWLPVKERIVYKILLLCYKALNGQAPSYLCELLQPYSSNRTNMRSNDKCLLAVPRSNYVRVGDRSFVVQAPRLWNSLPFHIKCASSLDIFKSHLKTYLFSQA